MIFQFDNDSHSENLTMSLPPYYCLLLAPKAPKWVRSGSKMGFWFISPVLFLLGPSFHPVLYAVLDVSLDGDSALSHPRPPIRPIRPKGVTTHQSILSLPTCLLPTPSPLWVDTTLYTVLLWWLSSLIDLSICLWVCPLHWRVNY